MANDEDQWSVVLDPIGRNPDTDDEAEREPENMGGMVIYLEDADGRREELSRVAFVRRASKNPDVSFEDQLDAELEKADMACAALNRATLRKGLA